MPHSIRLRAGWVRHIGSHQTTVGLPDASSLGPREASAVAEAGDDEVVRYVRPFNCPTGLVVGDERVPVDLVIESWSGVLIARLDGEPLCDPQPPAAAPLRLAVTDRLGGHHQLELELAPQESDLAPQESDLAPQESEGPASRLSGIVTLEIHD